MSERSGDLARIIRDPSNMAGKPVVRGARITVEKVLEQLASKPDLHELLSIYPELTVEDVQACLAYACQTLQTVGDAPGPQVDVTPWINRLVTQLKGLQVIRSPEVEESFRRVPRHKLLERFYVNPQNNPLLPWQEVVCNPENPQPEQLDIIYADRALCTLIRDDVPLSSTSQPLLMAMMLEALKLSPGHKVLEIGAGTGYNAALLAELVGDQAAVVSVDIEEDLVERARRLLAGAGYPKINLVTRDGFYGHPEEEPYDRIVATVGCPDLSPHWAAQLKETGFMFIPLAHGGRAPIVRVTLDGGDLKGKVVCESAFIGIQGALALKGAWWGSWPPPSFDMRDGEELPLFAGFDGPYRHNAYSYFLAMRDSRTFISLNPPGYGLSDGDNGIALVDVAKARILVKGNHVLFDRLRELHAEWQQLGRPGLEDYEMQFVPISTTPSALSDRSWAIERKYYRQIITLPETN